MSAIQGSRSDKACQSPRGLHLLTLCAPKSNSRIENRPDSHARTLLMLLYSECPCVRTSAHTSRLKPSSGLFSEEMVKLCSLHCPDAAVNVGYQACNITKDTKSNSGKHSSILQFKRWDAKHATDIHSIVRLAILHSPLYIS